MFVKFKTAAGKSVVINTDKVAKVSQLTQTDSAKVPFCSLLTDEARWDIHVQGDLNTVMSVLNGGGV